MTLSVELLSETPVSTAVCIDGNIYVNVWTSAPTLQQLHEVMEGERRMPRGYRSLDIVERMDKLAFDKGVKELFQAYAKEVSSRLCINIMVMRAGGFAGAVVHGVVGMANIVGLPTPVANTLEEGLALLLKDVDVDAAAVQRAVVAHIARHVARVPPPGR
jgi:hypothetical protein